VEFKEYIKPKIREALEEDKKQGPRRDEELLTGLLNILFWKRISLSRTLSDILPSLHPKYKSLKKDTLEDNLEYLSKTPKEKPFLKISRESQEIPVYNNLLGTLDQNIIKLPKKKGKPKNIYTLDDEYIIGYYGREHGLTITTRAYIAPHSK